MKALFVLISIISTSFISQQIQPIETVNITTPTGVSIDQTGNIYFATFNGIIVKYDPLLAEKSVFSPSNPNTATLLEAWQGLRIFSFHRDVQQFRLINRNLSLHEDYGFPPELIGFAEVAFPASDNNVWVVDQQDLRLKKYDVISKRITVQTALNMILDSENYTILHAREYQNKLFISTKSNGILIFDNLGNFLKTYQYQNVSSFNFLGDELYFIDGNSLVKLNLYQDGESKSELPNSEKWKFALINGDHMYLFSDSQLALYK